MKSTYLSLILIILIFNAAQSQEPIIVDFMITTTLDLEIEADYQYLAIDSGSIWHIGTPDKEVLSLPENLGQNAIFTDTNLYYSVNSHSSFQLKLALGTADFFHLRFYVKIHTEPNKDGGILETSWDNGTTWSNILFDPLIMNNLEDEIYLYELKDTIASLGNQPGFTGEDFVNGYYSVDWRNPNIGLDTLLLRFTFASDSNETPHEGWLLDDFSILGLLAPVENSSDNQLIIYPNPANNYLLLLPSSKGFKKIEIYSITGNIIMQGFNNPSGSVDVSSLSPGVYIISFLDGSGIKKSAKFIKL
jgi:hypothetical protein